MLSRKVWTGSAAADCLFLEAWGESVPCLLKLQVGAGILGTGYITPTSASVFISPPPLSVVKHPSASLLQG